MKDVLFAFSTENINKLCKYIYTNVLLCGENVLFFCKRFEFLVIFFPRSHFVSTRLFSLLSNYTLEGSVPIPRRKFSYYHIGLTIPNRDFFVIVNFMLEDKFIVLSS